MCGIVALLTHASNETLHHHIEDGLRRILNRGYDSIGLSILPEEIEIKSCRENNKNPIKDILKKLKDFPGKGERHNIIGHTRWATHGEVNLVNCHPHRAGRFIIVHNGIVQNQADFDRILVESGVSCRSDTDTERIVQMIRLEHERKQCTVVDAIDAVIQQIKGGFAIVIQDVQDPFTLYCARRDNPLLVGGRHNARMICSEKSGLSSCETVWNVVSSTVVALKIDQPLEETRGVHLLYRQTPCLTTATGESVGDATEAELMEQPSLWRGILRARDNVVDFDTVPASARDLLLSHKHLFLVGCGTSYNVAMASTGWFRSIDVFDTVQAHNAVDFDPGLIPRSPTLWILISQSGETLDLLVLLRHIRSTISSESTLIGLINVRDSLIWRECSYNIDVMAGLEKGVASTKSFSCQALQLYLFSRWLSSNPCAVLSRSPDILESVIDRLSSLEDWVEALYFRSSILILGRYSGFFAALESALKLTELSQIHTEAYSSGSLKHGPFALLDEHTPVIFIHTSDVAEEKTVLSIREILARRAPVFLLTPDDIDIPLSHPSLSKIAYPDLTNFRFLPPTILLQKLAILLCRRKGFSVDYPRNLAKAVTVE